MRLIRVFFAAAFLLAQQTAFAHQIWHAAGEPEESTQNSTLCEQHASLATVLGALNGWLALPLFEEAAPIHFPAAHSPAAGLPGLPPASRGPPALL